MSVPIIISVYCLCIVAASVLGGYLPWLVRLTHTRIQIMMSAVGGLMLGIGLFHLLPHAVGPDVSLDRAIWWLMLGLLTTFLLMRVFHAHQHAPATDGQGADGPATEDHDYGHGDAQGTPGATHNHADHNHADHNHADHNHADHDHAGHDHAAHDHAAHDHNHHRRGARHRWLGIFLGLSLHTLLDGVALSASVIHDAEHTPKMVLYGFAVFLGVLLHKPLDSLSITTLMSASGWSVRFQQVINFSYALMCPLGAALFYFGVQQWAEQDAVVGCALAFAAGIFICIALADLLPELQFHAHDRLKLTVALLLGVVAAYLIGYLEPPHAHTRPSPAQDKDEDHGDAAHEHDH